MGTYVNRKESPFKTGVLQHSGYKLYRQEGTGKGTETECREGGENQVEVVVWKSNKHFKKVGGTTK